MICYSFKFILVFTVISIIGMWVPYVYAVIPVNDSEICMCDFLQVTNDSIWNRIFSITNKSMFQVLNELNLYSYFITNLVFLVTLIFMGFKISYIRDNLSLTKELITVVVVWILCSTLMFVFYLF